MTERRIHVELGERSYDVRVAPGLLAQVGPAVAAIGGRRGVVIGDDRVAGLYGAAVAESLRGSGVEPASLTFPAGEPHKTLATYARLIDELLALRPAIDRQTVIVALGGGVSGDMAGFIAATALRGLRFVQAPTTLLAAVDASVGGKTGVDTPAGKNLVGAFHQPRAVLIDVVTLATLDARELRNGLAECVKHAAIRDWAMLDLLESGREAILAAEPEAMTELVARNVAIKAAVVAADERESSVRAHLNLGHTVGHAIETAAGFGAIGHGEAVALGMIVACELAVRRGVFAAADAARIRAVLDALGLPTSWAAIGPAVGCAGSGPQGRVLHAERLDPQQLLAIMQHDKKARAGRIRMVLPTGRGEVAIFDDTPAATIADAIGVLG